jgi:glucokinase
VRTSDEAAQALQQDTITPLANALLNVEALIDVVLVVFEGGVAPVGQAFLDLLAEGLVRVSRVAAVAHLAASTLGAQAGMLGAGLAAWELIDGPTAHSGGSHVAQ